MTRQQTYTNIDLDDPNWLHEKRKQRTAALSALEPVELYNQNHDKRGRFSRATDGGVSATNKEIAAALDEEDGPIEPGEIKSRGIDNVVAQMTPEEVQTIRDEFMTHTMSDFLGYNNDHDVRYNNIYQTSALPANLINDPDSAPVAVNMIAYAAAFKFRRQTDVADYISGVKEWNADTIKGLEQFTGTTIQQAAVAAMQRSWQVTASKGTMAYRVQMAASNSGRVDADATDSYKQYHGKNDYFLDPGGKMMKSIGIVHESVYRATQKRLAREGLEPEDTITLFRGHGDKALREGTKTITNPLSSWTYDRSTAQDFGRYVASTRVKVKDIWSYNGETGVGCKAEGEMILYGRYRTLTHALGKMSEFADEEVINIDQVSDPDWAGKSDHTFDQPGLTASGQTTWTLVQDGLQYVMFFEDRLPMERPDEGDSLLGQV